MTAAQRPTPRLIAAIPSAATTAAARDGAADRTRARRPAAPLGAARCLAGALLLTLAGPAAAFGEALRCDGSLVSVGDTKLDLLGRCGAPALLEREVKERSSARVDEAGRTVAGRAVAVPVERWTYDLGPRTLTRRLTIEGGQVMRVDTGGYGYSR